MLETHLHARTPSVATGVLERVAQELVQEQPAVGCDVDVHRHRLDLYRERDVFRLVNGAGLERDLANVRTKVERAVRAHALQLRVREGERVDSAQECSQVYAR